MKTKFSFLLIILFVLFIVSCNKDNPFHDEATQCILDFHIPYNTNLIDSSNYFKGTLNKDSICIYHGDGNYRLEYGSIIFKESLPGEEVNPLDTSKIKGISFFFGLKRISDDNSIPFQFEIECPLYEIGTPWTKMINDISNNQNLLIGDDFYNVKDGYTVKWYINCDEYNLSPIIFSTGMIWGKDYQYDQYDKYIKLLHFEKKKLFNKWIYDITFDINVNIFTRRGYYGELKGIFNTHFALKE